LAEKIRAVWSSILSYPEEEREINVTPGDDGIWLDMKTTGAVDPGNVGREEYLFLEAEEALKLARRILEELRRVLGGDIVENTG